VIQIDAVGEHIGRRVHVDHALVGDAGRALRALHDLGPGSKDGAHLGAARAHYLAWGERQDRLAHPDYETHLPGRARALADNASHAIRPEVLAASVDRHAADDAVFTSDTGMSTVWLARFVTLRGSRRLIGSYNLGSMANALPQALGAAQLDRARQTIAFCGDGGLTMLMGELLTVAAYRLPVKIVLFDNSRLGMVKLEQEQGGVPEFGTVLHNPDMAALARACGIPATRVEHAADVDGAVKALLAQDGPALLDVVTNPDEIALPPRPTVHQAWGFAIAKIKETLVSSGDPTTDN
jgi:pyruvate dehydrogenase (quinone)